MELSGLGEAYRVYPHSIVEVESSVYGLVRGPEGKALVIAGPAAGFLGEHRGDFTLCPLSPRNAQVLRGRLPWLSPATLGLQTSAGCGDRLGSATPGHIRAVRAVGRVAPIFAQQSVRENARTGRTPQQVMDDAMWGVFQEGWRLPWGADADHLKTPADIDAFVAAGYTFFTIDPGAHVDNAAHTDPFARLSQKYTELPWDVLEDSPDGMRRRYLGQACAAGAFTCSYTEESLLRAACKYGRALAHTAAMYRHLQHVKGARPFELEVSVDETETHTSALEHLFMARELRRLAVEWVSLAPRYVGRFEKGVDYIGDLDAFDADIAQHAEIARALGPYKLSIHSGSDKFSIYGTIAQRTGRLVHLKTAGTSYLEALRAVAHVAPALFRDILALAIEHYDTDRASYHVSADAARVPRPETLSDGDLPALLDDFHGRVVLHVTFGSALERFGPSLSAALDAHEEAYYTGLQNHFEKHLRPFG